MVFEQWDCCSDNLENYQIKVIKTSRLFEVIWVQDTNNVAHNLFTPFAKGFVALQFIMTSSSGSSRLLVVCCCVSFASVFLYCIGYVRLELELRAYKERLETIEQNKKQLVATPIPSIPTSGECIWRTMKSCFFVELLSRVFNFFQL